MNEPTPDSRKPFRFRWTSSYRLEAEFEVTPAVGGRRILALRYGLPEYDRAAWNYTPEEFEREVTGALGILHWRHGSDEPPPEDLLRDFVTSEGSKYPKLEIRRGHYAVGRGWVVAGEDGSEAAAGAAELARAS